jgi:flagellum-specific ATP synthase
MAAISFTPFVNAVRGAEPMRVYGRISEVIGLLIESTGPAASIGDVCLIQRNGREVGRAEVVGFRKERTLLMPLGPIEGIHSGLAVISTKRPLMAGVGKRLKGRVLDGMGNPIDSAGGLVQIGRAHV